MDLDTEKLNQMVNESLEAYLSAGWDEASTTELTEELASFLEGTGAATLAISPIQYKRDVQRMLEQLWIQILNQIRDQLPQDPREIAMAEEILLNFIINHLSTIIETFSAFFQGKSPRPSDLAPIIAVILLYLLQRWRDYLKEHPKQAS